MKKKLGSFLLAILVLSGSFSAEASGYRCQAVLRPTLSDILVRLDQDNNNYLFKGDLQSLQETLSRKQKRKLRKILNDTSLGDMISENQVTRFADDLGLVLFGRRVVADNYILKSELENFQEMTEGLIAEKLLRRGLKEAWETYSPEKTGMLDDVIKGLRWSGDKVSVVLGSRVVAVLKFPFLSRRDNLEIGDRLMQRIIREGFDKHAGQAMRALKAQSRIDGYEAFRRIYNPVMITSVTTALIVIVAILVQENNDRIVNDQLADLDQVARELEKVPGLRNDIVESKIESARQDFIKEWGELPTAAEEFELREKITIGINKKLKELRERWVGFG